LDRLLIDECLTQALVGIAKSKGTAADHVVWLGKSGAEDRSLVLFAVENDYILVTNNRCDFLRAYKELDIHSGLIILVPSVKKDLQIKLFLIAFEYLLSGADLVNKLVEVFSNGDLRVTDWSAATYGVSFIKSPGRAP
jgi:predicted nuclease of predicted toxin-antitoxin system